jgi:hypothetical protein
VCVGGAVCVCVWGGEGGARDCRVRAVGYTRTRAAHQRPRCRDRTHAPQVYNFNVPTFGKGVVYDVDQRVRTEQFRFFTEALKKERLKKYVPQFAAEAEVRAGAQGRVCRGVCARARVCVCVGGRGNGGLGVDAGVLSSCARVAACTPCSPRPATNATRGTARARAPPGLLLRLGRHGRGGPQGGVCQARRAHGRAHAAGPRDPRAAV